MERQIVEYPLIGDAAMNALANYIAAEMARRGWTLTDLAAASDVPDSTLSRYVRGTVKNPRASVLARIARGLGTDWAMLMDLAGLTSGVAARAYDSVPADVIALLLASPELVDFVRRVGALPAGQRTAVLGFIRHLEDTSPQ